jgi:hypothetical protein
MPQKSQSKSKKTWEIINEALNRSQKPPKIDKIVHQNRLVTKPVRIADTLKTFFANAGQNISNSVNPTSTTPESFVENVVAPEFHLGQTS